MKDVVVSVEIFWMSDDRKYVSSVSEYVLIINCCITNHKPSMTPQVSVSAGYSRFYFMVTKLGLASKSRMCNNVTDLLHVQNI